MWVGLICGNSGNSFYEKGFAELGEHVFERDVVFVSVPGLGVAAGGEVVAVAAVQGLPDDHQAVDAGAEWHGAFDRALQAVAGLADAE